VHCIYIIFTICVWEQLGQSISYLFSIFTGNLLVDAFFTRHFLVSSKNNKCRINKSLTAWRQTGSNPGIACWYRKSLQDFRTFRFQIKFSSRPICIVKLCTKIVSKGRSVRQTVTLSENIPTPNKKNFPKLDKSPFFFSFQHIVLKLPNITRWNLESECLLRPDFIRNRSL